MVYVDDMYTIPLGQFGRMKMSHMAADTHAELIETVEKLGLNKKWIQHEGEPGEHFDISISMRKKAIELGVIPVSMRELCPALVSRESNNHKLIIEKISEQTKLI